MAVAVSFDEAKLKKTMSYEVSAPVESVLADIDALRSFDKAQEKSLGIYGWAQGLGCLGVVVFFVLGAMLSLPVVAIFGVVAGLVSVTIGTVMKWVYGSLDLDDRRYEFVASALKLLRVDMAADAPVAIAIDFRKHNHRSKYLSKGKVGRWNAKFYVDPWLQIQGRFLDGTKYTLALIEKQQDRKRTKVSASGKLKTKTKTKNASEAVLSLKVKSKRYPQLPGLQDRVLDVVKLPHWAEVKSVGAEGDVLTLRAKTKEGWEAGPTADRDGVNLVAMMFLSLYRLLNASK